MPKNVDAIVSRVRDKLSVLAGQRRLPVAIECTPGVAWSHNPPESVDELLHEADRDMQDRKERDERGTA
jgi:PleD family two-component response regulator